MNTTRMNRPCFSTKMHVFSCCLMLLVHVAIAQVPKPADPQSGPLMITGATIHIGNGQVIENGALGFDAGKVTFVGPGNQIGTNYQDYTTIQASGKHVYPGLILPSCRLGLAEVSALRPTRDYGEVGDMNPNVRALISYNTDSELIATLRYNGILTAQSTPESGTFSGTSSIMNLDGWNWEDAVYKADDGVHLNWPPRHFSGNFFNPGRRENTNYEKTVSEIKTFLADAKSYYETKDPEVVNLKLEALKGVFAGEKKLYIHVNGAKEILESLQTVIGMGIEEPVIVGGADAYYVKDYLVENKIPVLLGDIHRLPVRPEEDVDMPFKLPYLLQKEGILVGLAYRRGLQNSRNLPFYAGTSVAYGMSKEEALAMITLNTAKILGIDATLGSLETGKDANIIVSEGDILDMRSSQVSMAFILGKTINLDGKQQLLYERFKEKYEKQGY